MERFTENDVRLRSEVATACYLLDQFHTPWDTVINQSTRSLAASLGAETWADIAFLRDVITDRVITRQYFHRTA